MWFLICVCFASVYFLFCFVLFSYFFCYFNFRFAFKMFTPWRIHSFGLTFDKFSSRGLAAPKMAAACLVSARAFMGSVTVRGFNTNLGRSASSVTDKCG